jgi:hypothetical protein
MTQVEKTQLQQFQNQMSSSRGVAQSQWPVFMELRAKKLIEMDLNPEDYDLSSRFCERKN